MLAYFVEQFRGRIETTGDIADLTAIPIVGALPTSADWPAGPRG